MPTSITNLIEADLKMKVKALQVAQSPMPPQPIEDVVPTPPSTDDVFTEKMTRKMPSL